MSVDFNECDYCYESKIDDYCYTRIINGNYVCSCDSCINKEMKKGNLILIDKEADEYDNLTEKEKEDIKDYGEIYKYTKKGKEKRLNEINKQLEILEKEKAELI
jgi:ABC-type Na+ transport system ATPase subunit NatA